MTKDFEALSGTDFITTRMMIGVLILVEVIIQSFSLLVAPTEWMTWQLLGFITATNLGAVLLTIQAQRQADRLGGIYKAIFTPDFYRTMNTISSLDGLIREEASKDGRSMDEELQDLAPKLYGFARNMLMFVLLKKAFLLPKSQSRPLLKLPMNQNCSEIKPK